MPKVVYLLLFALAANPIASQTEGHHELGQQHSPYADQESSGIAALSLSELGGLQDGAGMGLARAAELNHYPGPKHVLELAAELNLSEKQSAEVEEIRLEMLAEAKRVGQRIVEKEIKLNRRFAHRHIDESTLRQLTREIADLYGELRYVHIVAHLHLSSVLTRRQIEAYDSLRGYEETSADSAPSECAASPPG